MGITQMNTIWILESEVMAMVSNAKGRGALLIGYDTEAWWAPDETLQFLEIADRIHTELQAPCTLFIVGKVLEMNPGAFQRIAENQLFDLQQHTYSHIRLKPVNLIENGEPKVLDWGTPEQVYEEIEHTNELFRQYLGRSPLGLTGPYANHYENGLRDAPKMLEVIHKCGIRFLRCFGKTGNNLPLEIQPFWYSDQGYPDILEFPFQKFGYEGYKEEIPEILNSVTRHGYVWDNLQHEWDVVEHDPELLEVRMLVTEARKLNIEVASYNDYYQRLARERAR